MKYKFLIFSFFSLLMLACQSVPKDITYFQDLTKEKTKQNITSLNYIEYEPKIRVSDALVITVSSPDLNQDMVAQFNLPTTSFLAPGEKVAMQSTTLQTYIVNKSGEINYPVVGKVKLGGLPLSDAIDTMTVKVAQYIENPIVNVNIISFKISVLGEVRNPGTIMVTNSRISVVDAIGAAGDLTIFGNRKNIRLIRDNDGKPEVAYLDLTTSEIFSSHYFYLQQNDVIVVDPNDTRKKDSKYGQSEYYKLSLFSTVLSTIAVLSSVFGLILK